jgi:hypothetical protein
VIDTKTADGPALEFSPTAWTGFLGFATDHHA